MMDSVRVVVAGSYDCLEKGTIEVIDSVENLLQDDSFTLGGLVSTSRFPIHF
jgi:hypothetical protein